MSFSDELRFFGSGRDSSFADPGSRRIIERWLEYGNPDEMYEKLLRAEARNLKNRETEPSLPPLRLNAKELIRVVLSARHGVERLIAHEAKTRKDFEDTKNSFAEHVKLAASPQEIEQVIEEFEPRFEALMASVYGFDARTAVSRKDQNGSRTKRAFALRVQNYLKQGVALL
jgi:predicted component of type VI protein secretion system